MTSQQRRYPIAPVLRALGFEDVPDVPPGRYGKVRCLFHGDRTPSASVSRYGFRCFTCDRSGDAIKLLREEEGLSFADADERAADIAGGEDHPVASRDQRNRRSLLDV